VALDELDKRVLKGRIWGGVYMHGGFALVSSATPPWFKSKLYQWVWVALQCSSDLVPPSATPPGKLMDESTQEFIRQALLQGHPRMDLILQVAEREACS